MSKCFHLVCVDAFYPVDALHSVLGTRAVGARLSPICYHVISCVSVGRFHCAPFPRAPRPCPLVVERTCSFLFLNNMILICHKLFCARVGSAHKYILQTPGGRSQACSKEERSIPLHLFWPPHVTHAARTGRRAAAARALNPPSVHMHGTVPCTVSNAQYAVRMHTCLDAESI